MSDIEFVNGLIVKAPHPKAPDFVKAQISIKVVDLLNWLNQRSDQEWINIDVKTSKAGKWYAAVSQYKKDDQAKEPAKKGGSSVVGGKELEDDLPFISSCLSDDSTFNRMRRVAE